MKTRAGIALLVACLLTVAADSQAQANRIIDRLPVQIPGLEKILKRQPAITTSFDDAVFGVPFLDGFNPESFSAVEALERTPDGFLKFPPGLYRFDVRSFCLQLATYAPRKGSGEGYLYAPIKGPRADIVRNVLKRSFERPEIPQEDVQVLLWAIISYAKLSEMSAERQLTASALLSPRELFELNGGALGLIPEDLLDRAFAALPPGAGRLLQAEAELRGLLTESHAPYEDLESVAVLRGDPPEAAGEDVPQGRWSLRPEGFFVRYFPDGYEKVRVEIYIPEFFKLQSDARGRITLVADDAGNRVSVAYDDAVEPIRVTGEPSLKGFAFRSVRFERADPSSGGAGFEAEWHNLGWTLLGVPVGRTAGSQPSAPRFPGLEDRYERALEYRDQLLDLDRQFKPRGSTDTIANLGHFAEALEELLTSEDRENPERAAGHLDVVRKAWQYAVWIREMYTDKPEGARESTGNDAVPRNPGEQRLMLQWLLQGWNLHDYTAPWFPDQPRPFRRPMLLMGVVR